MFHQDMDAQLNVNLSTSLPNQAAAGHDTFTMGRVGPTFVKPDSLRAKTKNFFKTGTQKLSMEVNEVSEENLATGHQLNRNGTHREESRKGREGQLTELAEGLPGTAQQAHVRTR